MDVTETCRLELVSARRIKRMSGMQYGSNTKNVEKVREFTKLRGYCRPVVLSDGNGCMTLLSGSATFEACIAEKGSKIPAVIVQTEGEADNLIFSLQSAGLDDSPGAITVSGAIVRLVDEYGVPRKYIANALKRSPAWINRMESLCRRLNITVQAMVTEGRVPPRTAQEIARLPYDIQTPFAISAGNEFLGKDDVKYLVNRYLDEYTGDEERERIIRAPRLALPDGHAFSRRDFKDSSAGSRLLRGIARMLGDAAYLIRLLDDNDIEKDAVRVTDIVALADILGAVLIKLKTVFTPGKNESPMGACSPAGGDADD